MLSSNNIYRNILSANDMAMSVSARSAQELEKTLPEPPNIEVTDNEDFLERVFEYGKELVHQPATGRNFEIGVEYPNDSEGRPADLIITPERGARFKISSLFPEGYRLQFGDEFSANLGNKIITVPIDEIETRGFFLTLFHEIGHAWRGDQDIERLSNTAQHAKEILETYIDNKVATMQQFGFPESEIIQELESSNAKDLVADWFAARVDEHHVHQERGAHAIGLRFLRDLEKSGLRVLAGYHNFQEVKDSVDWYLSTYELNRYIKHSNSINSDERYKTKFVRSWNRFYRSVTSAPTGVGLVSPEED